MSFNPINLLLILIITPSLINSIPQWQPCNTFPSWIRGQAYGQMGISHFSMTPSICQLSIQSNGNNQVYTPGQLFTVTISSTSGMGHKIVSIGGGSFNKILTPGGGLDKNNNWCANFNHGEEGGGGGGGGDRRRHLSSSSSTARHGRNGGGSLSQLIFVAPNQGGEIHLRALCGSSESQTMAVSDDIVLQPGDGVLPLSGTPSSDPGFQNQKSLSNDLTLYYKKNTTHLDYKIELIGRSAWIGFGIGNQMVSSTAIIGMDPSSNPGNDGVALYTLTSKSGPASQLAPVLANSASMVSSYGIVASKFTSSKTKSVLVFSVILAKQSSKFMVVDTSASTTGVNIVWACGSGAAFSFHQEYGTLFQFEFGTGGTTGGTPSSSSSTLAPTHRKKKGM
jgi:hypothetical protein